VIVGDSESFGKTGLEGVSPRPYHLWALVINSRRFLVGFLRRGFFDIQGVSGF